MVEKNEKGLTVKKENDLSEWYSQIIQKAELAEHSSVSGCIVFRPNSYQLWEKIQEEFNTKIKKTGHKNVYFPLLIPEKLLIKETEHIEGFSPEVAWVTHAGDSKLNEKLAIRPTSETIIYESYSKWVRSYRDLPLLLNQWCNVVRWEFKHAKPFLRTREFLWQEGHTVHATREEAWKEVITILNEYVDLVENLLAIPVIKGTKTKKEKFAGAEITTTMEALMPDGKALQMGTSHLLGQNFAKAFEIKFIDKDEKEKFAWTTSWGISTRLIGAIIMVHGDNSGLVIPPKLAYNKLVIVPIIFDKSKEEVLRKAKELKQILKEFNPIFDNRLDYSAGWKFNEWELKGIPLRIEIGPKDLEQSQVVVVRRDNKQKESVKLIDLNKRIKEILKEMQTTMFEKAKTFLTKNTVEIDSKETFQQAVKDKKMIHCYFCETDSCEEKIKDKTGATARVIEFEQKETNAKCAYCDKKAKRKVFFAKNY